MPLSGLSSHRPALLPVVAGDAALARAPPLLTGKQTRNNRNSASSANAGALTNAPAPVAAPLPVNVSLIVSDSSDSEFEDSIVLKDGRRFPAANHEKHVNTAQLLAVIYFCVVGGPYGLDDAIRAASNIATGESGAGWVVALLLIVPLTLHLPMGLLTSELASAMPQNGGYIIWVSRAFGNFWGFQSGWLSWASSLFDAALYPILCTAYLEAAIGDPGSLSWMTTYLLRVFLTGLVCAFNLTGVQVTGVASLALAAATLSPFFAYSIIGTAQQLPALSFTSLSNALLNFTPVSSVNWGLTLSCILWVGSGWDSPGTVAGDVHRPRNTYPRAVYLAVLLVAVTNLWPVLIALLAEPPVYSGWDSMSAFWSTAARNVGGSALQWSVLVVAVVGNFNLFNVLFTSASWSLYAVALPGLLDLQSLLAIQPRFRTPHRCMIANFIGISLCCLYSFSGIIQVTMALNSLALLLECFSIVWLRVEEPKMRRPYRIPLSTLPLALFMLPTVVISLGLVLSIEKIPQILVGLWVACGFISYLVSRQFERTRQLEAGEPLGPPIDLNEVFEELHEHAAGTTAEEFPDFGLRTAAQVESLPESIAGTAGNEEEREEENQEEREAEEERKPLLPSGSPIFKGQPDEQKQTGEASSSQYGALEGRREK